MPGFFSGKGRALALHEFRISTVKFFPLTAFFFSVMISTCKAIQLYTVYMEFDKNIRIGWLLDYYGEFLTPRQRDILQLHHYDDLSLGEIAERMGITRQGVHDALRRGAQILEDCEQRLGLLRHTQTTREALERLLAQLEGKDTLDHAQTEELRRSLTAVAAIWEGNDGL